MDFKPANANSQNTPSAGGSFGELLPPAEIHVELASPARPYVRKLELLLLLGIGFGSAFLNAFYIYWHGESTERVYDVQLRLVAGTIHEAGSLGLLAYILFRQGRRLRDIGFSFRSMDIPVSVGLFLLSWLAYYVCYLQIYYVYYFWTRHTLQGWNGASSVLGTHFTMAVVLFILINPFFEELIVRGYVMAEIITWTKSISLATIVSVGVQTLYHVYQGIPSALSLSAGFLVFAVYYGRTRRILPVILAHLYADALSLAYHFGRH